MCPTWFTITSTNCCWLLSSIQVVEVAEDHGVPVIRRRTVAQQLRRGPGVALPIEVLQRELVPQPVVLGGVHHLAAAHECVKQLRVLLDQPDAQNTCPRDAVQIDPFLPEPLPQQVGQGGDIGDEAVSGQLIERNGPLRLAGAGFVPTDHREVLLQRLEQ